MSQETTAPLTIANEDGRVSVLHGSAELASWRYDNPAEESFAMWSAKDFIRGWCVTSPAAVPVHAVNPAAFSTGLTLSNAFAGAMGAV